MLRCNDCRRMSWGLEWQAARAATIAINFSCRITLELLIQDEEIIPVNVGDHDVVY